MTDQVEGDAITEAGEGDSTSPAARDYEAEARQHGWTPKEEFRGDTSKWVDAETFVKRADEVMPFLKKQNAALKREIDDMKRTMKQFQQFATKAEERAYDRAMADLQAKHQEAVEAGDVRAAKAVVDQMRDLKPEAPVVPSGDVTDDAPPANARDLIDDWVAASDYYQNDPNKTAFADLQYQRIEREHGALHKYPGGIEAALKEIDARVSRKFSAKPPVTTTGTGAKTGGKSGRTYADLPPQAKAQCDRFVKIIPGFTKEQFVRDYDWS